MSKDNPAHIYRQIAKRIVAKLEDNLSKTVKAGQTPDVYFSLEQAIVDAMRYADQTGNMRAKEHYMHILKDFEDEDGTTSS